MTTKNDQAINDLRGLVATGCGGPTAQGALDEIDSAHARITRLESALRSIASRECWNASEVARYVLGIEASEQEPTVQDDGGAL